LDSESSYTCFETWLETLRQRHGFEVHGYVLMPEHVHLLMSEPERHSLDNTLRALKGQTSKEVKGDRDNFWQKGGWPTHEVHILGAPIIAASSR